VDNLGVAHFDTEPVQSRDVALAILHGAPNLITVPAEGKSKAGRNSDRMCWRVRPAVRAAATEPGPLRIAAMNRSCAPRR
jgi:hypothetical protein